MLFLDNGIAERKIGGLMPAIAFREHGERSSDAGKHRRLKLAEEIAARWNAHDELVAALRLFHPNNATELYERAAEDFYKATRLMAPGKSVPLELAYDSEQEAKRQELWRPFIARWREQFIDAVLAKAGAK